MVSSGEARTEARTGKGQWRGEGERDAWDEQSSGDSASRAWLSRRVPRTLDALRALHALRVPRTLEALHALHALRVPRTLGAVLSLFQTAPQGMEGALSIEQSPTSDGVGYQLFRSLWLNAASSAACDRSGVSAPSSYCDSGLGRQPTDDSGVPGPRLSAGQSAYWADAVLLYAQAIDARYTAENTLQRIDPKVCHTGHGGFSLRSRASDCTRDVTVEAPLHSPDHAGGWSLPRAG